MCGISVAMHFGKRKKEPVNLHIMNVYEDQFNRGTEGFGLIQIGKPTEPIRVYRATEPIKALLDLYMNPTMMGIFHHRSPTSTKNSLGQTHPVAIEDDKLEFNYAVVHNGGVSNAEEMYKKHQELDFLYRTYYETYYPYKTSTVKAATPTAKFLDSEALAIELARFLENKIEKLETQGTAAFIVLQCKKDWTPIAMHFGRSAEKPLNMHRSDNELYLSSEGVGEAVKEDIIYTMQLATPTLAFSERPFNMAKAPVLPSIYGGWSGHQSYYTRESGYKTLYRGICTEQTCREERVQGTNMCVMHCDPKFLTKAYGTDDPTKLCKESGCHKKARTELGSGYCKKHRSDETPQEKLWTCKEFQDKDCLNCKHTRTPEKYPTGFKTEAERARLDAKDTEVKTEVEDDERVNGDTWAVIDNVINEFFDFLDGNNNI